MADNSFAFKLLRQLAAERAGESTFVSPYSAATALHLVLNGAVGGTKKEMQQVLDAATMSSEELNQAGKAAADLLNSGDTNVVLTTANALWYQQGAAIEPNYLELSRKFFSSAIRPLDFGNLKAAASVINQWANDQTHGHIQDIANGVITRDTDLFLANAIYFKGKWQHPFVASATKERAFQAADGTKKQVPMMQMSRSFAYREGTNYQAVRLPYAGNELAMYVFLPAPDSTPATLLNVMNGDSWQRDTMPGFGPREGMLMLPKFKLENTLELKRPLQALGMQAAFDPTQADFSDMFGDPHHISAVCQKAYVAVSEEGTEAAAVTGITVRPTMIPVRRPKPFEMIVNRPFLFAIVDSRSGIILFMGVVNRL